MPRKNGNSGMQNNRNTEELISNVGKEIGEADNITLRVLYEDSDIIVFTAPNEDELREIVLNMLREGPKTLKDMHSRLAGIASEDKIRRCLIRLMDDGIVTIDDEGKYRLLGIEGFDGGLEEESEKFNYF
ncbi:ArsR family transcriptional regulator [Ignisphaera sp. 4213-co]|uniref:ArsR family transcriptional regulator n=1 Tax=Ignisphaera cupida TaxID=3050454 RepID=A0ABD4Z698_9CREN|nr:ArsR family transcriptional regulator [Ignisphaera sp. 4213-co]MDK6028425.1 ArsR family transcriptional regulator [Ignisphaera sp. 4213-co]